MPAIVYQTNKSTGITYAYESVSYWDKEKQQSRATRKCIGKVDPVTGKIVPTRKQKAKTSETKAKLKPGPTATVESARYFYGATYLLDQIGAELGLNTDLKKCFPDRHLQILSIAYFLVLEDNNPLMRFPKWAALHKHPFGEDIPSQRSSELFASIREEEREQFFCLQGKRRLEDEYWAYDITTISSYSKCLKQVKHGYNKEHDLMPQINLALVFGEKSNLPFYYRKLAGNIPDVKTVKNLLADMDFLSLNKVKLLMDRGFYSEENINRLFQYHYKFLMATKVSLNYVKAHIDSLRAEMQTWSNYSQHYDLYASSSTISWQYSQQRPYKQDEIKGRRRLYLHLYYNSEKATEDERRQNILLANLQQELIAGNRIADHEHLYSRYFETTSTPVRGVKVKAKQDVINEAKKNYGYFALISNDIKDPIKALEIYRNKDLAEKAFGNLKERLNFRRALVSSDQSLDGKLFVEFIALIYLSYVKKKMQEKELFKKYTMQGLLDQFDVIECFEQPGRRPRIGEMTKKQLELYEALGVTPPSLQ
jgi:transposase